MTSPETVTLSRAEIERLCSGVTLGLRAAVVCAMELGHAARVLPRDADPAPYTPTEIAHCAHTAAAIEFVDAALKRALGIGLLPFAQVKPAVTDISDLGRVAAALLELGTPARLPHPQPILGCPILS